MGQVKLTIADLNHNKHKPQQLILDPTRHTACALEVTFARPLRSKSNIKKASSEALAPTQEASAVWQIMNCAGTECRSKQCVPTTNYPANYNTILSRNNGDKRSGVRLERLPLEIKYEASKCSEYGFALGMQTKRTPMPQEKN